MVQGRVAKSEIAATSSAIEAPVDLDSLSTTFAAEYIGGSTDAKARKDVALNSGLAGCYVNTRTTPRVAHQTRQQYLCIEKRKKILRATVDSA